MNYQDESGKQKTRKRKIKLWFFFFLSLFLAALCVFSAIIQPVTWKYRILLPDVAPCEEGELRIHVLDAKHGDCTFLQLPNGETVLLGGGADDEESRENVLRFLYAINASSIDYVVATGTHRDQNGALERVAEFFKIKKVYDSLETGAQSGLYSNFISAVNRKGIECVSPQRGEVLYQSADGSCTVRFLSSADSASQSKETLLHVSYGETSALLGGRMGTDELEKLMQEDAVGLFAPWRISFAETDIVKIGSAAGADTADFFLRWSGASTVVMSCREELSYRPSDQLLSVLNTGASRLFRTDQAGRVTLILTHDRYRVETER